MKIEDAVQINCSEIAIYFNGVYFFLEDSFSKASVFYFLQDLLKLNVNEIKNVIKNLQPCVDYEGGGGFHWDDFWNTVNLIYRIKKNPKEYENIRKIFKLDSDDPDLVSILWNIQNWYIDFGDEDNLIIENYDETPYKTIYKKGINYYPGLILEMLGENKNAGKNNSRRTGNKKKSDNNKTKQKRNKTIKIKNSRRMAIT